MSDSLALAAVIARHAPTDGSHQTAVPRLFLTRASQPTEPRYALHQPAFCMIAGGRKRIVAGDRVHDYGPGRHMIVSVDMPVSGAIVEASPEAPYLGLRLDLDRDVLAAMLLDIGPDQSLPEAGPARCFCLAETKSDLVDAVVRLVRLLDTPEHIRILAPMLEREILYRLYHCGQAGTLRQIAQGESRLQQVNRAIGWIKRNFDQPFSIDMVAAEARMSASSLHLHFKEVTSMSPLQYQKRLRLQEARRLILSQSVDAAVAGHRVGYDSPSQFSREYRRLFGAPPIRDIERLKATPQRFMEA